MTWTGSADGFASGLPRPSRYANHRERIVPIVPRLRELLLDGFADAEEGAEQVLGITRTRIALHRVVGAAVKRAEVEPIARVFQTCRQSRETDWARTHPQHAVSAWLGHSVSVSIKHYLTVTDDLLDAAAGLGESAAKSAAECSGIGPQGAEPVASAKHLPHAVETGKQAFSGEKRIEADGSRTRNHRIDSPVL